MRFAKQLLQLAPLVALPLWLTAVVIGFGYAGLSAWLLCLLLLPFFVLNSTLGFLQLKAFTNLHYWDVVISGLGLLLITGVVGYYEFNLLIQLTFIIIYLFIAYLYLKKPLLPKARSIPFPRGNLGVCPWFFEVLKVKIPVQVHMLRISINEPPRNLDFLVNRLSEALGGKGGVTIINSHSICCYQLQKENAVIIDHRWLVEIGCGLICDHDMTPVCQNGKQVLVTAIRSDLFTNLLPSNWSPEQFVADKDKLLSAFRSTFPHGIIFDIYNQHFGPPAIIETIDREIRRRIFTQAQLFVLAPHRQDESFVWHVSALYFRGSIAAVFAIPKNPYSVELVSAWHKEISSYNLCALLSDSGVEH